MKGKVKTLVRISIAVLLVSMSAPTVAIAAQDTPATITKTHTYMASAGDVDPAPDAFEQDNIKYKRVSITEDIDADYSPDIASYVRSKTLQCAPENLNATKASFDSTWRIDEDGIVGYIDLVSIDATPIYANKEYKAEQYRTFANLATNDTSDIATTDSFVMDKTGNTVTLERAGISWSVDAYDANNVPLSYTATVLYRGTDIANVLDHYDVSGSYAGDIQTSNDKRYVVIANYEAEVEPEVQAEPEPEPALPEPEPEFPWAAVAGGGVAGVAVAGGAVIFIRRRNVKLVKVTDNKAITLKALSAKRDKEANLSLEIPPKFDLSSGDYRLVLRPDIARARRITITHLGRSAYLDHVGTEISLREVFGKSAN